MQTFKSRPQTLERYNEIDTISRSFGVSLADLFELPAAPVVKHDETTLCIITLNELVVYDMPSLTMILYLTGFDAEKAGIKRRGKRPEWFAEQLETFLIEKGKPNVTTSN